MNFKEIENAEIQAWLDLFAAQPANYRHKFGFQLRQIDGVWMATSPMIPFPHFNCPFDLGIETPMTEQALDAVLAAFKSENITKFYIHLSPASQPNTAKSWLTARGLQHVSSWHRIVRPNTPLSKLDSFNDLTVEDVTTENAVAWANFIDAVYGMPTGEWLLQLVGRQGWHHVICREAGKIVAARSMKINADGTAYFMIDAPVPGVMTQRFEPDLLVSQRLVEIGLAEGVQLFTADIEKMSPTQDTAAYHFWSALGFKVAFEKKNFML